MCRSVDHVGELTHLVLFEEHVQLDDGDAQVGLVKLIRRVPADRAEAPPLLDDGVEEAEAVEHLFEGGLRGGRTTVCSVYEQLFETLDVLSALYMIYGGHSYTSRWTFSTDQQILFVCFFVMSSYSSTHSFDFFFCFELFIKFLIEIIETSYSGVNNLW